MACPRRKRKRSPTLSIFGWTELFPLQLLLGLQFLSGTSIELSMPVVGEHQPLKAQPPPLCNPLKKIPEASSGAQPARYHSCLQRYRYSRRSRTGTKMRLSRSFTANTGAASAAEYGARLCA